MNPSEPYRGPRHDSYHEGLPSRRHVRAASNIRFVVFGSPGPAGARKPTRPIATGTFSFPAFLPN